jgi:hypothetical protein
MSRPVAKKRNRSQLCIDCYACFFPFIDCGDRAGPSVEDRKSLSVETEVEEADMRRDRVMNPSNFTLTSDDRNNRWIAKLV